MPHDKANAYAASHRFSVNQALGVLEVRNEIALEQMQPSLATVAKTADARLFAHVNDADLTRLGIDEHILPVVRLLSSEAHWKPCRRSCQKLSTPHCMPWPAG